TQGRRLCVSATLSLLIESPSMYRACAPAAWSSCRSTTTRRATGLADAERSNDDMGEAAVFFERHRMADDGYGLALDLADAAERVPADRARRRNFRGVAILAVGKEPIVDAVVGARGRWQSERAVVGAQRDVPSAALDQHVGPAALPAHQQPRRGDD